MAEGVLFERHSGVFVVTFNRPDKGNALSTSMAEIIRDKLKEIEGDRTIRAILLRGAGDCFMDGSDMTNFSGDVNIIQELAAHKVMFLYAIIRKFRAMERAVIAAVDGRVSGAGFNLMLASDLVIATKRTVFNTGFTPFAMVPDSGATFFLPRKVGMTRANELLLLSEDFSAEQAEKWGLINKIAANDALQSEALAWAEKIATGPTRIYGQTKRLIDKSFEHDLNTQLSQESVAQIGGSRTLDFREAVKAYAAKRKPKYTGA